MRLFRFAYLFFLWMIFYQPSPVFSQVYDTIANWDGINVDWSTYGATGQVADNPDQQGINPSANCFEVTTSDDPYDFMYTDFSAPINFSQFPIYRIKIWAPETGGSVLLKFENSTNTSWQEIEKTPVPGQWDDLEFDFSGTTATDFVRMVIFVDFQGSIPNKQWLVDDVIGVSGSGNVGLTSNLPIVIIQTNGVEIPDEPKITGYMGIIDNGLGNINNQYDIPNDYDGYIGIEIRGQSTQMYPKKSYGFETRDELGENLNISLLGMPAENDWILYAPYSDKSMLRNFITFYMGSQLDPYCSRLAFCEVIVNNDYKGVYILMEKIKKDENRVNIATLNPEDIAGDELTGGYIVKVDKIDPGFVYGTDGWKSTPFPPYPNSMNITFQYYYPKAGELALQQSSYIHNFVTTLENALTHSTFANPNVGYNKYLNTGSFVDQMILNEIAKEVDNYRYSTFFYKEKDSDGGKLFAGPAWDFNFGYANVDYWPPGIDFTEWMYGMVEPVDWGIMFWWKRLMEDPYFRNLSKTRWLHLRQNELSNNKLEYAIDSIVNYIDEAQQRNYVRWPILGAYVYPNYNWQGNDYVDEVAFFENWFFNRISWMDDHFPGTVLYPEAELSGAYPELEITLTDDYFNRQILKKKHFTLNDASAGIEIDTVMYINASKAKVILSGNENSDAQLSITMKAKILNSFEDLTTNQLNAIYDLTTFEKPMVRLYPGQNSLFIECSQPALLGNELEVFNLSGQLIETYAIQHSPINNIHLNILPGIYICRFMLDGLPQTRRVVFLK